MATIVNRVSEQVMSISNEQIARTISVGSDWSWLRVGILYELSHSAGVALPSPELAIGLSSGTGSLYYDSSLKHFIGVRTDPTVTYQRASGNDYHTTSATGISFFFTEKTSSQTEVSKSGVVSSVPTFITGSLRSRGIMHVDFVKSSADPGIWNLISWTVGSSIGSNIGRIDLTPADLYSFMSSQTQSRANYTRTVATWPVSESYRGMLNTVNVSWNLTQSCEISDVAVYRFR